MIDGKINVGAYPKEEPQGSRGSHEGRKFRRGGCNVIDQSYFTHFNFQYRS